MADVTITFTEYNYLYALWVEFKHSYGRDCAAEASMEQIMGMTYRGAIDKSPEWLLIDTARSMVLSQAFTFGYGTPVVGEETVNGEIYDGGTWKGYADRSMRGPASLLGKVALELCRRLEGYLQGDIEARRRGLWAEQEMPNDPPASDG